MQHSFKYTVQPKRDALPSHDAVTDHLGRDNTQPTSSPWHLEIHWKFWPLSQDSLIGRRASVFREGRRNIHRMCHHQCASMGNAVFDGLEFLNEGGPI